MKALIASIKSENVATRLWLIIFLGQICLIVIFGVICLGIGSYRVGYAWTDRLDFMLKYVVPAALIVATLPLYVLGTAMKIKRKQAHLKDLFGGIIWIFFVGSFMAFGAYYLFLLRGVFPWLSIATGDGQDVRLTYIVVDDQHFASGRFFRELELKAEFDGEVLHTIWMRPPEKLKRMHGERVCLIYSRSPIGFNVSAIDSGSCVENRLDFKGAK